MKPKVKGLHHFTAISGDPTGNAKFYVNTLGMRLVKKTVNHDAPQMYHLFYGDKKGTPGSSITFFPGMADHDGEPGAGMVTELGLRIPKESVDYWQERLENEYIDFDLEEWHDKKSIAFEDPDGLPIRLVPDDTGQYTVWEDSYVPEEKQIRGMHHVTLSVHSSDNIAQLLEKMELELKEDFQNIYFEAEDGSGVEIEETNKHGRMGRGSVHHVAFKAGETEEELEKWRAKIKRFGLMPSQTISRKYFTSFYFRTPPGILFEFSSMGPGYTADESVEELGTNFVLPEKLEGQREQIKEALPEFHEEEINQ